jgi:hypothetical protein
MAQIAKEHALEQGMMIAEVNIAIGAIDRTLKVIKDDKSNNRATVRQRKTGHARRIIGKASSTNF